VHHFGLQPEHNLVSGNLIQNAMHRAINSAKLVKKTGETKKPIKEDKI